MHEFKYEEIWREETIECPYCHHRWDWDSLWEGTSLREDDDCDELQCDDCGKTFHASLSVSYSYTTTPDCKLNNEEHKWVLDKKDFNCSSGDLVDIWRCTECGEYDFRNRRECVNVKSN